MDDALEVINLNSDKGFKYLGSVIHKDLSCYREVGWKISKGGKVISMLNSIP